MNKSISLKSYSTKLVEDVFFKVHLNTLRETSRGTLTLRSNNPFEHPNIDPNFLNTEDDRIDLRNAVKLSREIFLQKAFDLFRGNELLPGKNQIRSRKFEFLFRTWSVSSLVEGNQKTLFSLIINFHSAGFA